MLNVGLTPYLYLSTCLILRLQAFRKLSKGMAKLADVSDVFKSRTISGLLRGAPDLLPHLENVEKMYQPPEKG